MKPFLRSTAKKIKIAITFRSVWRYLLFFFFLPFLASCIQPTYPAERVIPAVKKLCKDEYNLDVHARILGTTLGVAIPIEGLVDKELKLAKEAAEKIEDVALSMRRVILSTDRPIDFYIVCARDTQMGGAEYVMVSNIMDVKRIAVLDISREEYLSRIQRAFRLNPELLGETIVKSLFQDLNEKMMPELALAKHTHLPISTQNTQEILYPTIFLAEPQSINYQIISIETKEISDYEALIWVKTKETYQPKAGAERGASIFAPGFVNEYLLRINRAIYTKPIAEIVPKFFAQENTIQQRYMDKIFDSFPNLAILDREGLPIKEINLKEFSAKQMARRLKERLEKEKPFQNKFQIISISCIYEDGVFKLNFNIKGEEKEIFKQALNLAGEIIHGYQMEDFATVLIISQTTGTKIAVSKEKLEQFRRKKITLGDLL